MDTPVVLLMCRVAAFLCSFIFIVRIILSHMLFGLNQVMRLYLGLESYALAFTSCILMGCSFLARLMASLKSLLCLLATSCSLLSGKREMRRAKASLLS